MQNRSVEFEIGAANFEIVFVRTLRDTCSENPWDTSHELLPGGARTVSDEYLLVPVASSKTLRQTVEYAVDTALEDGAGTVRFVYVYPSELDEDQLEASDDDVRTLLSRVEVWARDDADEHADSLTIETARTGADRFIFSPEDLAKALAAEAQKRGCNRIVLDPEYDPGIGAPLLRPLEVELTQFEGFTIEEATVSRDIQRAPLLEKSTPIQVGALFGVSFIFYQILAGQLYWFDIVTGIVSATIVGVGLSRVTFLTDPTQRTLGRVVRLTIYIPYLLKEIIKANIIIAAVILHPRLPVEPRLTRIKPAVWGSMPITTLANSITLTPGTLTVRADGRTLKVHTLVPAAREDLFDGGLERAVRFVFYGPRAMSIGSPRERGVTQLLDSSSNPIDSDSMAPEGIDDIGEDEIQSENGGGGNTAGGDETGSAGPGDETGSSSEDEPDGGEQS